MWKHEHLRILCKSLLEDRLYPWNAYEELAEKVIEVLEQCVEILEQYKDMPTANPEIGDAIDIVCKVLNWQGAHYVVDHIRENLTDIRSRSDFRHAIEQSCDLVRNSVGVSCL